MDQTHFKFVPLEQATTPPNGLINHIKDHWWCVHPEKGVMYYVGPKGKLNSPQCNSNADIARRLAASYPDVEVRFIPSVFHRIDPSDYT